MGGFFGVVSKQDCTTDLFFGTDYHSHLGTVRGGLATWNGKEFCRYIHDITNAQFRSKFEDDISKMQGNMGIGVISDTDDQPLLISSHLGFYAIVTVGVVQNLEELAEKAAAYVSGANDGRSHAVSCAEGGGDSVAERARFWKGMRVDSGRAGR